MGEHKLKNKPGRGTGKGTPTASPRGYRIFPAQEKTGQDLVRSLDLQDGTRYVKGRRGEWRKL